MNYHLGRMIYKRIPWNISFVISFVFVFLQKSPEDYLCNVAAAGMSIIARKEFAL